MSKVQELIYIRESAVKYILDKYHKLKNDTTLDATYKSQQLKSLVAEFQTENRRYDEQIKEAETAARQKEWDKYYNEPVGSQAEESYKLRKLMEQQALTTSLLATTKDMNKSVYIGTWTQEANTWLDRKVEHQAAAYIEAIKQGGGFADQLESQLEALRDEKQPNREQAKKNLANLDILMTDYNKQVFEQSMQVGLVPASEQVAYSIHEKRNSGMIA